MGRNLRTEVRQVTMSVSGNAGVSFRFANCGGFSHVSDSIPTEQTYDLIRHCIEYSTSQSFLTWIGQQNV